MNARLVIWLLAGSVFVMILNETIMSVALPVLIVQLQVSTGTAQWLTSGFLLTMAVVIPITGFLLRRFPARAVYLTAMSLFSIGTLLAALAPGFGVLLAARVVQASGTAVMTPLLMTTILTLVPAERRGQTMGTLTIVTAVAPAVGPTLSGVVLSTLGWRWLFWVVLPIALVALAVGAIWLRLRDERTDPVRLDVLSVPLSAVAFAGLVLGLSLIGERAHGAGNGIPPWVPLVLGAVSMVAFVARQLHLQRRGRALLDLRPFSDRRFTVSLVLIMVGFMSMFGMIILLPLYIQNVQERSAFVAGLMLLPGGLLMGVLGPIIGRAYDRYGARYLVVSGAVLLSAALWTMSTLDAESSIWEVVLLYTAVTTALSAMFTPLMTDSLATLPADLYSHGSAILATIQQVAGAAGTALFVTVVTLSSVTGGTPDVPGVQTAFRVAAAISVVVVLASFLTSPKPRVDRGDAGL
ncbi:DHA2 family efflux MFS transporter permease subunit [Lentzea sp. NPDC042327]|uniref:DHA2 family efflux MFS transporter permease subunit n=1 Tax=Lentzea sp. NPDC042327 TaxID=3154801 RepID=UPI0033DA42C7